ncbi:MAG: ATP-dependent DNA helicase RecG [Alphaproteobacteria bacterium]|nr:ATP-dependent DNA helicase RecG [Alphaproteobacteria bacterium]
MRPDILNPLFAQATSLPGIGPRLAKLVEKVAGAAVVHLLWHLPRDVIDRSLSPAVADAPAGTIVTLRVAVDRHMPGQGRRPYRIRCSDESGFLTLIFFHAHADYLTRALPEGQSRIVSGIVEEWQGKRQMTHPDYILTDAEAEKMPKIEPVYGLTAGLTLKTLGKAVREALDRTPELAEWLDPAFLRQRGWAPWRDALRAVHFPAGRKDLEPTHPHRARLAYDELLANQLALGIVRARMRKLPGRSIKGDGRLQQKVAAALPFRLTGSQHQALAEIDEDMAGNARMLRLLQGDVGSGKTVVALLAMLKAVECGGQAALMAPTEILARQHFATIDPLLKAAGLKAAVLTGRDKGAVRKEVLAGLADGSVPIVVGTHALFQKDVAFHDLMLAVIDEQHRFGVHQRLTLASKGRGIDTLVMTATPIPRTLLLTSFGDMESSRLTEKPAGRKPIATRTLPVARIEEVIAAIERALPTGAKVYWVCPLVEESEVSDLADAEARFADLKRRFGDSVELVHGRMKGAGKDQAMLRFAEGSARILVATTVIEVGVDVPDATIMVIEHAERFGLAQLHQLRGRIGRGVRPSSCLLLYAPPLTETAKARLQILRESEDGFRIAEEDLRLRGGGEILGTRQSGMPEFRLADLSVHGDLLAIARDDVKLILARDPELTGPRGQALRTMLYLFERDSAVLNLRSG